MSGRKIAKTSAFHTQLHLCAAAIGKSACSVVQKHSSSSTAISPWRKVNRAPCLGSAISQPPNAAQNAISESGSAWTKRQPMFCGASDVDVDIGEHPQERRLDAEQQQPGDEQQQREIDHGSPPSRCRRGARIAVEVVARQQPQRHQQQQSVRQRKGEQVDHPPPP